DHYSWSGKRKPKHRVARIYAPSLHADVKHADLGKNSDRSESVQKCPRFWPVQTQPPMRVSRGKVRTSRGIRLVRNIERFTECRDIIKDEYAGTNQPSQHPNSERYPLLLGRQFASTRGPNGIDRQ